VFVALSGSLVVSNRFADDELERRCGSGRDNSKKKDLYAADFGALTKRWDKCINVGGGYVEKCFFHRFEYRTFYVLYPFVTYILTLPSIKELFIPVTLLLGYDAVKGQYSLHCCSFCFSQGSVLHVPPPISGHFFPRYTYFLP
jgi:hypothetical protein